MPVRFKKALPALLALLVWAVALAPAAHAAALDLEKTGSISVAMTYAGQPVAGGTLTLYRVGDIRQENGAYAFYPTGGFADCGVDFAAPLSQQKAQALAQYAAASALVGDTQALGAEGFARYADLAPGLYLLVQGQAATGYEPAAPFFVTLPLYDQGEYRYDVNASPKVELVRSGGGADIPPVDTGDPTLPQTGQLNWPVPVLAALGLALFAAGWALRFGGGGRGHEA